MGRWNVMVEINNESSPRFPHEILRPDRVDELITRVRHTEQNGRRLLVSTSYPGPLPTENVAKAADFVLVHGNNVATPQALTGFDSHDEDDGGEMTVKPVLFNEDDHTGFDASGQRYGGGGEGACVDGGPPTTGAMGRSSRMAIRVRQWIGGLGVSGSGASSIYCRRLREKGRRCARLKVCLRD